MKFSLRRVAWGVVAIRINVMKAGAITEECGDRAGKEWCAITGIEADYQGVSPRLSTDHRYV